MKVRLKRGEKHAAVGELYLVDRLLALLVFLGLFLHLLSLLYLIDELEQVSEIQDHGLGLGKRGHIIHSLTHTTHTMHTNGHTLAASELMKCNNLLFPTMW